MIEFNVTDQRITLISATSLGDILVSNTENNYKCKFNFNDTWNEYSRIAVFMPNDKEEERVSILLESNECYIPMSILEDGNKIRIGVYGRAEGKTISTVYSSPFLVRLGAVPVLEVLPEEENLLVQLFEGGEAGQVLTKNSDEKNDFSWKNIEGFVTEEEFEQTLLQYAKIEELEELSNFVDENKESIELLEDNKMEYAILTFNGSAIQLDGEKQNFAAIKELCLDKKHFTYLSYSNRLYIPQYVNDNNVFFEATYIDNEVPYMHRISINSRDLINVYTKALVVKTELDDINSRISTLESNKADNSELARVSQSLERVWKILGENY